MFSLLIFQHSRQSIGKHICVKPVLAFQISSRPSGNIFVFSLVLKKILFAVLLIQMNILP